MRRNGTHSGAAKAFQPGLFAILVFCAIFPGCENACVTFMSNPGSTITVNGTTCPMKKATGNVALHLGSSPAAGSSAPNPQHIFVSLRGVEALATPVPGGDSSEWQELAPDLATKPVQVDLMAPPADQCGPGMAGNVPVPAGVYSQLRFTLVQNQLAEGDPVPEENACDRGGFNCIIARDGSTHPLVRDDAPEMLIPSRSIAGGNFRVLPDEEVHLAIEFDTLSSLAFPAGNNVRLVPAFAVSLRPA
jgi:hypothetical protein